jgi:hypothetical protein
MADNNDFLSILFSIFFCVFNKVRAEMFLGLKLDIACRRLYAGENVIAFREYICGVYIFQGKGSNLHKTKSVY